VASGQVKSDTAFNPMVRKTPNEDSLDLLDLWPWRHGATSRIWSSSKLTTHVNCQSAVGWYLMTTPKKFETSVAGSFKATPSTNQCLVSSPSTSASSVLGSKLPASSESLETTEETGRQKRKRDPSPLVMADDAASCQGRSTAAEPPLERQHSNKCVKRSSDVQTVQRV